MAPARVHCFLGASVDTGDALEVARHAVMPDRICIIVNPAAGCGRGAQMMPDISARFAEFCNPEIRTTAVKGDESAIANQAIAEGFTTLVAVGGDGTTSNVANAILHSGAAVRLAVMPAGTGNDFARLLGTVKSDAQTVARLCANPLTQRIDVGRVEDTYFLNSCGFGFDVAVLRGIASNSWLRGSLVYVYTALTQLFAYRAIEIGVTSDASVRPPALHLLLVVANAAYFGGGFEIAPGASATDAQLDAVSILDVPAFRRIVMFASAARGKHEKYQECVRERASEFDLSFSRPPMYETDGELHHAQSSSLRISSCPSALRVVAPPGALDSPVN